MAGLDSTELKAIGNPQHAHKKQSNSSLSSCTTRMCNVSNPRLKQRTGILNAVEAIHARLRHKKTNGYVIQFFISFPFSFPFSFSTFSIFFDCFFFDSVFVFGFIFVFRLFFFDFVFDFVFVLVLDF